MDEQALNEKLNEWAGTTDVDYTHPMFGIAYCFRWLVPKIAPKTLVVESYIDDGIMKFSVAILSEKQSGGLWCGNDTDLALALCLAIEKLVDERNSSET